MPCCSISSVMRTDHVAHPRSGLGGSGWGAVATLQSIGAQRYRQSVQSASIFPRRNVPTLGNIGKTISPKEEVERTDYGERLLQARLRAGMTQRELAEKAGFKSQGSVSELEVIGQGSSKTTRLAEILGVRPQWLADGVGPMVEPSTDVPAPARQVASEKVAHYLVGTPAGTDYRTIALTLAAALQESGTEVTLPQFIKLLEATYNKLKPD
jgi:transcriptional regulator with XRE-family HTH domain